MARGLKKGQRNAGTFVEGDPRINRAGVSKEMVAFARQFREACAAELARRSDQKPYPANGKTKFYKLVEKFVALATQGRGNVGAIEKILDRMGGKVAQPISGIDGEPLRVIFENVAEEGRKKK